MNICLNCEVPLNPDWSFCDECGKITNYKKWNVVNCELHSDLIAEGHCVVCSQPACHRCAVKVDSKITCSDPVHQLVMREWKIVYRPDSEFEAESIMCNLKAAQIDAKTFSLHDYISTLELTENRILVFVKISEYQKANLILKELNLIENN